MKIQRIRRAVEIVFDDGSRREGFFFLSPTSAHRLGPESVEELLNSERTYLPLGVGQEEVLLISKNAVVMVLTKNQGGEARLLSSARITAEVTLRSGETLRGEICHDLPETHARLSDYLNHSGCFFHIGVASKDCFVASAFVKFIRPAAPGRREGHS